MKCIPNFAHPCNLFVVFLFLQNVLIDSTNFDKPLCPLCQRGFTYRKGVIEHIQILHGEHLVADLIGASDIADQKRLIDELQYK